MARMEPLRRTEPEIDAPAFAATSAAEPRPPEPAGRTIGSERDFGPIAMHQVRLGRGKPLLLLHGIGGSWRSWQPILDDLARERSIVAVDLPGFGESGPLAVPLSVPHLADQVTAFLRGHGLVGIDVVGVSTGGRLALELSRRGMVGTTVALDPDGFWSTGQQMLFYVSLRAADRVLRGLRDRLPRLLSWGAIRSLMLWSVSPRPWRLEPLIVGDELARRAAGPNFAHSLRSITFGPPPLGADPGSALRIVLGWGRHDRVCLPSQARRVIRLFPTAQLHWFDKAGHLPLWDCPDETVRLILDATA